MPSKLLDAYSGPLTAAQIADGMNAANENALRLLRDAMLLYDAGSYPTALSLAALSIEESGKVRVLYGLALAKNDHEREKKWQEYRSHTRKNSTWIVPALIANGARKILDFQPAIDQKSTHPFVLDSLKQLGLYSDRLHKYGWVTPEAAIPQDVAEAFVRIAQRCISRRRHTEREVELWIEHVGPTDPGNSEHMQIALKDFLSAMKSEGLATEDQVRRTLSYAGDLPEFKEPS